jgi:succinyl-CoA synthetase alpha subunit
MSILADQNVRVIVQGITGREAASFAKDMMDYGTRVVAGVTPGRGSGDFRSPWYGEGGCS